MNNQQLVKLCSGMIEAGRVYISANKLFVNGIRDLSHHCKKEEMISECLEKCGDSLQEIVNYHMILFDQAQRSVKQQLHNFVKEDVRKFKETKKQFDKVREDMEIAQVKNAQAPRSKPHEVEEATSTLITTRKCFRHLALDYVLQINVLQAKKKFEILDSMLSFMQAQHSLFQQGFNLLDEIDPYMKKLAVELDQLVIDSAMEKREMEHKHATIQQRTLMQDFAYDDSKVEFNVDAPNGVVMEGYLFKRASNAFKTWNRRWFSIQNSQLVYQKRLKAESEKLRQAWIQAVQASIASAYREISENYYIEVSPTTLSLGVHCSKVRSLTLDTWEPELMKHDDLYLSSSAAAAAKFRRESLFCPDELDSLFSYFDTGSGPRSPAGLSSDSGLGGSTDGSTDILVFGSVVDSVTKEECEDSDESSGEVDIEQEASDPEDGRELDPNALLHKASRARNLPVMAEALAHGADINSVSEEDESKSPLIQAVAGGSLIACELLLQNGADVNQRDIRGRAPLHHATCLGHTGQVCLFLKRGASQVEVDKDGQDPLSIAVQAANADIVTLLRLARMTEEMREADGPFGQPEPSIPTSPLRVKHKSSRASPRALPSFGSFRTWLYTPPKH
ncbi:arf-GAP with coiled-coil, ANK repeat and PH domain-containing protein 3-like [Sinocyclocheilus grahami]|uniref:arf-GAP with coiled-coil, ANK repeat and PH domain-containing protein 3-like n=1 Tax=Sinocyclocheilus grahami TaxID=75366 RepID=UPI0007ACB909|nr:PREDICTED: arf-GAP with coiled-coil, ANK repeat and PH domain-containing protein 3-like [Sinocyclocheilus grahami]